MAREKQIQDLKDTYEAVTTSYDDIKDKKIIELAKQKRNLQLQIDSLRTKAAKASETALKFKKQLEGRSAFDGETSTPTKSTTLSSGKAGASALNETGMGGVNGASGEELIRKAKELEKRVTKLRNENQQLTQTLEKATRLLE